MLIRISVQSIILAEGEFASKVCKGPVLGLSYYLFEGNSQMPHEIDNIWMCAGTKVNLTLHFFKHVLVKSIRYSQYVFERTPSLGLTQTKIHTHIIKITSQIVCYLSFITSGMLDTLQLFLPRWIIDPPYLQLEMFYF